MITIDQLLESVDLDFEPRWVTKDECGTITIFAERPQCWFNVWASRPKLQTFGRIKLAEFENKDWQECIYEVPRKEEWTKWVGKLCRFWDGDENCFDFNILKSFDGDAYITDGNAWYYHCKPVRPDDDVIYKGE